MTDSAGEFSASLRRAEICGNYAIERLIGRGGMGEVYEARHTTLDRRVAIKVLSPKLAIDERSLARFFREGRAAAQVRHPHVIDVFDCAVEKGLCYLVMEFVDGETLAEYVTRSGPLGSHETARLLAPVVDAVRALHGAGILHRDLKPANVLLATGRPGGPYPIVTDFGVCRRELDASLTTSGDLLGTPAYLAPEVVCSPRAADARSDQYALGVMLYECSTGRRPFAGDSTYALLHAIATERPAPPSSHHETLGRAWDMLVLRAMHRDPAQRFPSIGHLLRELLRFSPDAVSGIPIPPVAVNIGSRSGAPLARQRVVALAAVTMAAAALGAQTFLTRSHSRPLSGAAPDPANVRAVDLAPVPVPIPITATGSAAPTPPATTALAVTRAAGVDSTHRVLVARPHVEPRPGPRPVASPAEAPIVDLDP